MNNLKNLYPCLDSIRKYTQVISYETFVVAYLFSKENLNKLKEDYPWVIIIESNEVRGFSENNNLALRQAKGKYCFVLNDDTYFSMPVINKLSECLDHLPSEVVVVSPTVYSISGNIQHCGRPKYNLFTILLYYLGMLGWYENHSKFTNKKGTFQTYNIFGAAFMIRSEAFRSVGFFDERYFFCPEDIALSTMLNKKGMKCYVNAEISLTHLGGGTWSKTIQATKPATEKGNLIFFGSNNVLKQLVYVILSASVHLLRYIFWFINLNDKPKRRIMMKANLNAVYAVFSSLTPKELFVKYYKTL